jgi:hypothetical protein
MWALPKHPCFGYSLAHLHLNFCFFDLASLMTVAKAKSKQELTRFWTEMRQSAH